MSERRRVARWSVHLGGGIIAGRRGGVALRRGSGHGDVVLSHRRSRCDIPRHDVETEHTRREWMRFKDRSSSLYIDASPVKVDHRLNSCGILGLRCGSWARWWLKSAIT